MGEGGFEPPKALPADLQSVPFGHSGIPPYSISSTSIFQIEAQRSGFDLRKEDGGSIVQFLPAGENETVRASSDVVELVDGLEPPTC